MLHGGWPFMREIAALLTKPNAWLDFSQQSLELSPATLAGNAARMAGVRAGEGDVRDRRLPVQQRDGLGGIRLDRRAAGREALAIALTGMLRDGEITRARASELARMVLRENARTLYGL